MALEWKQNFTQMKFFGKKLSTYFVLGYEVIKAWYLHILWSLSFLSQCVISIFLNGSSMETKFYTNEVLSEKIINLICSCISNNKDIQCSDFGKFVRSVPVRDKYIARTKNLMELVTGLTQFLVKSVFLNLGMALSENFVTKLTWKKCCKNALLLVRQK